jgi:hypothetical protein
MDARQFTVEICSVQDLGGDFKGKTPGQAARKAARKLFGMAPNRKLIDFTLREKTKGSKEKEYKYVATQTILPEPKVIRRGDVEITVTKEYTVKAVK